MKKNSTMQYKWFLTTFFAVLIFTNVQAQDPHFSQFNSAPLQLNPAMAGVFEGQFRVGVNYRDQWGSVLGPVPFQTSAVNFDFKIHAFKEDYFAIGLSLLNDRAGESRYEMTQGHFTVSFMKKVAGGRGSRYDQYLIAGGQYGFGQQGINWNALQFSRQFDGQNFNVDLPNGEQTADQTNMYGDLNAGLMWYGLFGKQRSAYFGGAMHHLNSPNISFNGVETVPMYRRYTIHGGGEFPINRETTVMPSANILIQGQAFQTVFGAALRFSTREWDEFAIRFGTYSRLAGKYDGGVVADAVIVYSGLEWHDWLVGLSFDANTSSLSGISGGRGAFELSLTYVSPPARRKGMYCPKF